jgi:hypothetical protein
LLVINFYGSLRLIIGNEIAFGALQSDWQRDQFSIESSCNCKTTVPFSMQIQNCKVEAFQLLQEQGLKIRSVPIGTAES